MINKSSKKQIRFLNPSTKLHLILLVFCAAVFCFSSCNTTKYLELDKAFLVKNEIIFKGKVKNKRPLNDELMSLVKDKPTKRIRRWFHYRSSGRIQKRFGENPTLYNEKKMYETANNIKYYLQNKGYYDAEVKPFREIDNQTAKIKYNVSLNNPYTIDSLIYKSKDESILKILEAVRSETLLKKGQLLSSSLYNSEVSRLTKVIRNFGYANFYPNYFTPLDADTTNFKTKITMEVLPPEDTVIHRKYKIKNIYVVTEYVTVLPPTHKDSIYEGIQFTAPSGKFNFKINELLNCIPIRKGELFRQENLELMYSKFEQLKSFRLISIKQSYIPLDKNAVDIVITLAQNTKYTIDGGGEFNFTNASQRSAALGFGLNLSFKNNNVFKGGEKYIANIEGGYLGFLQNANQRFLDVKFQNDYILPKYVDLFGVWKRFRQVNAFGRRQRLLNDGFYANLQSNAQTKYSVSYNYIETFDLKYQLINLNYGYIVSPSPNHKIAFNHTSLEWLKPLYIGPSLDTLPFLLLRFEEQFVTSVFLKDINLVKSGLYKRNDINWQLRASIEQSGLELFAANKLYNEIALQDKPFQIFGSDYTRYFKGEVNYSLGKKIGGYQSLHFRANVGAAVPFGFDNYVPFVKQFIAGGPASMRAWRVRELGPGGFVLNSTPSNQLFFNTGDFKTELNAEYRFGLYWIFKGVFFIDAGNVWLLNKDVSQPNGELSRNFYKQIAVAAGTGIRIDFSYQVIRFDFGYRLRNPYADDNGNYWQFDQLKKIRLRDFNWSIALGYPF